MGRNKDLQIWFAQLERITIIAQRARRIVKIAFAAVNQIDVDPAVVIVIKESAGGGAGEDAPRKGNSCGERVPDESYRKFFYDDSVITGQ
jgi:hypothetical protein